MLDNLQIELSRNPDNETANMSNSKEKIEELQKAIARAQTLASNIRLNELTDLRAKIMMKDAIDKLASVQRIVLESEKSRLRSLQSEQRVNETQNEVTKNNNNPSFAMPKVQRTYKLTSKASLKYGLIVSRQN